MVRRIKHEQETKGRKGMSKLPKLIVVAGTNASGKSNLGIQLAKHYGGEVISADSRQVFRGLDLGSGKVTEEEMNGVKHHLIDVRDPDGFFSMAEFQQMAYAAIEDIRARGKLPFLVGGTGLYVASVVDGYELSSIAPDLEYREQLEKKSTPELYAMLMELSPDAQVEAGNRNRVMRMIERIHDGDERSQRRCPRYETLRLGVTWPREVLRTRIDERLQRRMEQGMLAEVQGLLDCGVPADFLKRLGLEYRYLTQYLTGEISDKEAMLDHLACAIKQFAKRQMTWFRRDKAMIWLDMSGDAFAQAVEYIDAFLEA